MECLSPRNISVRSKLLVPSFGERLKMEVRCGKCANCQNTLQREWYYRAFYEFQNTIQNRGYMLMDCLTYSDSFVPRLSRFYPDLPVDLDYMCFDYYDFRYFMVRLRDYLKRKGFDVKNTLRYFAAAEYGTDENCTHRPHIHILFYVTTPQLDNYTLSRAVSDCWHYGRTDGVVYKGRRYVEEYTIRSGLVSSQRACKYVSKYVMKDSSFQKVIDERINKLLYYYYENKSFKRFFLGDWKFTVDCAYREPKEHFSWSSFESFLRSSTAKKLKADLIRYMNQFHRQSLGFGLSAIDSMDIDSVIDSNLVTIPDSNKIVFRIGLPNYFRRKLFYKLVEVNGLKTWVLKSDLDSIRYKNKRDSDKLKFLLQKFELVNIQYKLDIDIASLADYVLNQRWRDTSMIFQEDLNIFQKLECPDILYNYSTQTDYRIFHGRFICDTYLGCSNSSYINNKRSTKKINVVSFDNYIKSHIYENKYFEDLLSLIKEKKRCLNDSIQRNFENRQRLNQIYKCLQM